jgi:hypothetical protein
MAVVVFPLPPLKLATAMMVMAIHPVNMPRRDGVAIRIVNMARCDVLAREM